MQDIYNYIDENWQEAIEDLEKFCAQPSISAQAAGIDETATMAAELLKKYGVNSQVLSTSGNPVVYGELKGESPYTLLFYNHYDVQPPEPLELWT
ncbi:MAG: peptidase M20, partial [Dehalococcoidia bacterium]